MVGPGWDASQNSGSEGLMSEVPVVRLGQTSKTAGALIIPTVATNNQPVTQPTGGANNCKFALNYVVIGLVSGHVCV